MMLMKAQMMLKIPVAIKMMATKPTMMIIKAY